MLAGGSSNVNNMYLSPRLSEERCLTYIKGIKKKFNKTTTWVGGLLRRVKAANEPTRRVTCGWAETQTLTKDSTAPLAMSKSVGRPPM